MKEETIVLGVTAAIVVGCIGSSVIAAFKGGKFSWNAFSDDFFGAIASSYTPESTRTYRDRDGYVTGYSTKRGDTITYKDRNGYVTKTVTKS